MSQDFLLTEGFDSLREIGWGLPQRVIPAAHRDRLMKFGYIEQKPGGLCLSASMSARHMPNGRT
jgi:hypothetical protein